MLTLEPSGSASLDTYLDILSPSVERVSNPFTVERISDVLQAVGTGEGFGLELERWKTG